MQRTKRLRRSSLLIVLLVCAGFATVSGQTKSPLTVQPSLESPAASEQGKDSETLKALEIANIRLSAANEKIGLLEQRILEKDQVIGALEGKDAVKTEMIDLLKSANKDRAFVNNGDARMLVACNEQLAKSEARIFKLEHPGLLKSIFDTRSATGFMMGYGAGRLQSGFTK